MAWVAVSAVVVAFVLLVGALVWAALVAGAILRDHQQASLRPHQQSAWAQWEAELDAALAGDNSPGPGACHCGLVCDRSEGAPGQGPAPGS